MELCTVVDVSSKAAERSGIGPSSWPTVCPCCCVKALAHVLSAMAWGPSFVRSIGAAALLDAGAGVD